MAELQSINVGNLDSPIQIILCHGFGSNMHDLVDIWTILDPEKKFGWHFLQAPIPIPNYNGFAWFPRSAQTLYQVMMGNYFGAMADLDEPGLAQAAHEISQWIKSHNTGGKRWIVGGFSQGSMVALRAAIQEKIDWAGLIILSGSLVDRSGTSRLLATAAKIPCFQSHGSADQVLDIDSARSLYRLLLKNDWPVEWHDFSGGHEIPSEIIYKLRNFLMQFNANR